MTWTTMIRALLSPSRADDDVKSPANIGAVKHESATNSTAPEAIVSKAACRCARIIPTPKTIFKALLTIDRNVEALNSGLRVDITPVELLTRP